MKPLTESEARRILEKVALQYPPRVPQRKGGRRPPELGRITAVVEAFYKSGLSQEAFCETVTNRNGADIQARTLRRWIERLEREAPARLALIRHRYE